MNKNLDSIKTVAIVVLVIIAGYFIYQNYSNEKAGQTAGKSILNKGNPTVSKQPDHIATCTGVTSTGYTFTGTWIVYTDGTHSDCVGSALPGNGGSTPAGTSHQ